MRNLEFELAKLGMRLTKDLMGVKPGQVVAITTDTGINQNVVNAIAGACHAIGAKPLILLFPQPLGHEKAADPGMACEALVGALTQADYWVEANSKFIHYSDTFNRVTNIKPEIIHILVSYMTAEQLDLVYNQVDYDMVDRLVIALRDLMAAGRTMRIINAAGTDIRFELDPNNLLKHLGGDLSQTGLICGFPSMVNCYPRLGTPSGRVAVDAAYVFPGVLKQPMIYTIEKGIITDIEGGLEVEPMRRWLTAFHDDNIYKVAHVNFGTLPSVREMTGEVILDERMWGAMNFGFGSVPPVAMPPAGQSCVGHWDAICTRATVWIDDELTLKDGEFVHPALR